MFAGRNLETCVQSEEAARDQLKKSGGEFSAADKTECVSTVKIGGSPSYAELITCLEMKRDVRKLRARDDRGRRCKRFPPQEAPAPREDDGLATYCARVKVKLTTVAIRGHDLAAPRRRNSLKVRTILLNAICPMTINKKRS